MACIKSPSGGLAQDYHTEEHEFHSLLMSNKTTKLRLRLANKTLFNFLYSPFGGSDNESGGFSAARMSGELETSRAARQIHIRRQIIRCRKGQVSGTGCLLSFEIRHCPVKHSGKTYLFG